MSDSLNHKLSEAIPKPGHGVENPLEQGPPEATHKTAAEQVREEQESQDAHNATASHRGKLIDIGKAHHQGGRTGGRVSDR